jgi:hypothetical protein
MTVSEMHVAVKLGLDKSSALELPSFEPEEIDYWLNVGQDRYIYDRYKEYKNNKTDNAITKEIHEELSPLIKYDNFAAAAITGFFGTVGMSGGGYYINIDSLGTYTLRHILVVMGYVTRTLEDGSGVTGGLVFCNNISISDLNKYVINSFNQKPYFENPVYFLSQAFSADPNRGMVILVDYYTSSLEKVDLVYIREPKKLNRTVDNDTLTTTCELPKYIHQRIVDLTVFLMIENIESNRVQTNALTLKLNSNE